MSGCISSLRFRKNISYTSLVHRICYLTTASPNESTACHIAGSSVGWRSKPNATPRDCQCIAESCCAARHKPDDHCAGTAAVADTAADGARASDHIELRAGG